MTKHIFVTGGVVLVGQGPDRLSLGRPFPFVLGDCMWSCEARSLHPTSIPALDPFNGEVFVTEDVRERP